MVLTTIQDKSVNIFKSQYVDTRVKCHCLYVPDCPVSDFSASYIGAVYEPQLRAPTVLTTNYESSSIIATEYTAKLVQSVSASPVS